MFFLFLRVKIQPMGGRAEKSLATIQLDCREAWGCSGILSSEIFSLGIPRTAQGFQE